MTSSRLDLFAVSDEERFLTNICPYCGNLKSEVAFVGKDQLLDDATTYPVQRCQACQGLFTDGSGFTSLAAYYKDAYPPVYHKTFSDGRDGDAGTNPGVADVLEKLFAERKGTVTVLDVGCGNGGFLNYLRSKGFAVAGVEINENAAAYCKAHYGIEVFNGPLELWETSQLFDVITMLGTIEHLINPTKTLSVAVKLLKPGGILVFDYPDLDSVEYKLVKSRWWGLDLPRHVLQLRQDDINKIIESAGLSLVQRYGVVRTWFHNSYLTPPLRQGISSTSIAGYAIKGFASLFLLARAKPLAVCICKVQATASTETVTR